MRLNKLGLGYCPFFRLAETRRLWAMLGLTVKGVIMRKSKKSLGLILPLYRFSSVVILPPPTQQLPHPFPKVRNFFRKGLYIVSMSFIARG